MLNFDDPYVREFGRGLGDRAVYYGMEDGATVRAVHVAEMGVEGLVFTVEVKGERASVQLRMLGRHNVPNALAADCGGAAKRDDAGGVCDCCRRDAGGGQARRGDGVARGYADQ